MGPGRLRLSLNPKVRGFHVFELSTLAHRHRIWPFSTPSIDCPICPQATAQAQAKVTPTSWGLRLRPVFVTFQDP